MESLWLTKIHENIMKRTLIITLTCLILATPSFGWGREGHEAIAKIADNHLKPSAKKKIEKYLGNHSIVYYAKWMDDYRKTKEYAHTTWWHSAKVDENLRHLPDTKNGDVISGVAQAISILENYKEHNDSTVAVNIKYLIHMIGDMHCPSHIYYKTHSQAYKVDFGGGYVKPRRVISFHNLWDEAAIQATRIWGLTDWAWELDRVSKKEEKDIVEGTHLEWFEANAQRCIVQFDMAKPNENVAQDFVNEAMPFIETQILYAGLRLAKVLNDLF